MKAIVLLSSLLIQFSFAHTHQLCKGFMPENDMDISVEQGSQLDKAPTKSGGISEEDFNDVMDQALAVYAPIVKEKGGELKFKRNWKDGTVNAYASREGDIYYVSMFGGLARHWSVSKDAFAMVVCHELGHHIGGIPTKGDRWASSEGQSDYFASLKCMRKLIKNESSPLLGGSNKKEETKSPLKEAPIFVKKRCEVNFKVDSEDYNICVRSALAGFNLATLLNSPSQAKLIGGAGQGFLNPGGSAPAKELSFETPDTRVVSRNDPNHPAAQCRLDTYFQGALCEVDDRIDVGYEDETEGTCARANGAELGVRPLCWFKPGDSLFM